MLGAFKFCTSKIEPTLSAAKPENKEKAPKGEQADKGGKKKGAEKKEEPKKSDKEEKERLRQEKLEAELKAHDEKVKAWLEAPCTFDFEEFKRTYCNAQAGEFQPVFK